MKKDEPKLLRVLTGASEAIPPVWFMRQAGRYLPEYRKVRAEAGSFLDLCYNPALATEVTLQPIRRYDLDAAILFSDILVIPHAFGQDLSFVEGEGPKLAPPTSAGDLAGYEKADIRERLAPVFETVRGVRAALDADKALIGFAGAPWTVATYMLAGGPSKDPAALRARYYDDPGFIDALMALLVERTADYLIAQAEAGADALQLFDTWAGGLPKDLTRHLSIEPIAAIAGRVKEAFPDTPIIAFAKGVGPFLGEYAALDAVDAVGVDTSVIPEFARSAAEGRAALQGGLDPLLVVSGGEAMTRAATRLLRAFDGAPYVFNLGHGFVPQTPPEHVAALVDHLRSASWRG